ncbi:hypothetical protein KAX17_11025 [Candidatus Bipolaricaulota bacterium]|nr:hypothetical protein [Candidatus Bipolaricaulota bacterium]
MTAKGIMLWFAFALTLLAAWLTVIQLRRKHWRIVGIGIEVQGLSTLFSRIRGVFVLVLGSSPIIAFWPTAYRLRMGWEATLGYKAIVGASAATGLLFLILYWVLGRGFGWEVTKELVKKGEIDSFERVVSSRTLRVLLLAFSWKEIWPVIFARRKNHAEGAKLIKDVRYDLLRLVYEVYASIAVIGFVSWRLVQGYPGPLTIVTFSLLGFTVFFCAEIILYRLGSQIERFFGEEWSVPLVALLLGLSASFLTTLVALEVFE